MPPEKPQIEKHAEDFDAKGHPRSNHEMPKGGFFFGSDEEFAEEMKNRREQNQD